MNQVVLRAAEASGVIAIDVERKLGKDPALFVDFAHFSTRGARAMATVLSTELLRLTRALRLQHEGRHTMTLSPSTFGHELHGLGPLVSACRGDAGTGRHRSLRGRRGPVSLDMG